jgi:hypothetical protein
MGSFPYLEKSREVSRRREVIAKGIQLDVFMQCIGLLYSQCLRLIESLKFSQTDSLRRLSFYRQSRLHHEPRHDGGSE